MCDHANDPGGREAAMTVLERDQQGVATIWCDPCIEPIIAALNEAGLRTIASCCGHWQHEGWVILQDGRHVVIFQDHESHLAVTDPALLASMRSAGEFSDPIKPMNARERLEAVSDGRKVNDAYGKPLACNSRGEWVNDVGDTPCPTCGEMVNKRCWACGWLRGSDVSHTHKLVIASRGGAVVAFRCRLPLCGAVFHVPRGEFFGSKSSG